MEPLESEGLKCWLERNRVIPAVKHDADLQRAMQCGSDIVFVLYGDIVTLDVHVQAILASGKLPFIHLDMVQGLANNPIVLEYFHGHFQRNCGVITTKGNMAKKALELGIPVIQRFFMLDSLSLESAIEGVAKTRADAYEIMPGIIPRVVTQFSRHTSVPIIAGGLIQTRTDVDRLLASGAVAVSTSRFELWP